MIGIIKRYVIEKKIMRDIQRERAKANHERQKGGGAHGFKRNNP